MKINISLAAVDKVAQAKNKIADLKAELVAAKKAKSPKALKIELQIKKLTMQLATIKEKAKETTKKTTAKENSATVREKTGGAVDLKQYRKYDPLIMKGKKWFAELNDGTAFPPKIEGFWRSNFKTIKGYPWPVPMSVPGYNRAAFVKALQAAQLKASTGTGGRGLSPHRWTGEGNFNSEYMYKGWKFPGGYITYIRQGVPPSRAFYKLITGEDNPNLPTYGR